MSVCELLIDFRRTIHCRYLGGKVFEIWLSEGESVSPARRFSTKN
ncbi:MAG TPA: hypothetical protein VMI31_00995 [Fimbriimonadaceae bacterium]|nr:hypothetical protein [Fimbriimonadaceae bacterium]